MDPLNPMNDINFTLNEKELRVLYEFIEHQYVPYEVPGLIDIVRRLGRVYNELASESSQPT